MLIYPLNGVRKLAGNLAFEPATEYSIDQQISLIVENPLPGHHHTAFGRKITPGCGCVTGEFLRVHESEYRHDDTVVRRKASHDITVAAIISRTTNNLPASRIRESFPRFARRGSGCTCHQRVSGDAVVLDCRPICLAYSGNGINVSG